MQKKILQRLSEIESAAPGGMPFLVFIDPITDGKYQVTEHITAGKFKKVKYVKNVISNLDQYLDSISEAKCTVIIDDMISDDAEVLDVLQLLQHTISEDEMDQLVDLIVDVMNELKSEDDLKLHVADLIKKYRQSILINLGFDSVDLSGLTINQLKKLMNGER